MILRRRVRAKDTREMAASGEIVDTRQGIVLMVPLSRFFNAAFVVSHIQGSTVVALVCVQVEAQDNATHSVRVTASLIFRMTFFLSYLLAERPHSVYQVGPHTNTDTPFSSL